MLVIQNFSNFSVEEKLNDFNEFKQAVGNNLLHKNINDKSINETDAFRLINMFKHLHKKYGFEPHICNRDTLGNNLKQLKNYLSIV